MAETATVRAAEMFHETLYELDKKILEATHDLERCRDRRHHLRLIRDRMCEIYDYTLAHDRRKKRAS